jgi:UDP-N-acetylmuramyl pentapeptide phosphotransferase/UDP-N-acetylglucosamine-1-phosphate transferase
MDIATPAQFLLVAAMFAAMVTGAAVLATWCALVLARRRAHVDVPNERSSHAMPTPKGGGLAIVVVVMAFLCLQSDETQWWSMAPLGASFVVACAIGFRDDLRPLRPAVKMCGLLLAAAFAAAAFRVETVSDVPFAGTVRLGFAALPLTVFWLAGYANVFNFMDGLNGIAGCTAFVSAMFFLVAGSLAPDDHAMRVSEGAFYAAFAVLGFLPFNFPQARIFLGDAGSLPLGLLLAWCAVRANETGALPFPASILLLGPFLFDVTFTLFRRWREGKTIGEAHKEHLYQRLSRQWGSHAKVSLLYAGFSVVTGTLALLYASMSDLGKLLSLVLPTLAMLGFAALVLAGEREKGR